MFDMTTTVDSTVTTSTDGDAAALMANAGDQTETVGHTFGMIGSADLPATVRDNLLSSDPSADVVPAIYASKNTRRASVHVLFSVAQADGWTPVLSADATHKVPAGKTTEYDDILTDACAVRGGTVLAIGFGYKLDKLGFRQPNYQPVRRLLVDAFTRLPFADRKRVDIGGLLILANDQQADDVNDVAGFFLLKIQGYRVK